MLAQPTAEQLATRPRTATPTDWNFLMLGIAGLVATILIAWGLSALAVPTQSIVFRDAAAVITIITLTAVAIERVFETFWTIIDMTLGVNWPVSLIGKRISAVASGLDTQLDPFCRRALELVEVAAAKDKWTEEQLDAAKKEIDGLKKQVAELKALAPKDARIQSITTTVLDSIGYLQSKYPDIDKATLLGQQAITAVTELLNRIKNNPGRTLISIYLGAIAGLIVSALFGLDMFGALLGSSPSHLGTIATGLIIGLGSNPTHEIIRAIQEIKNKAKA